MHPLDAIREGNPVTHETRDSSLGHFKEFLEGFEININPPYQRNHVWTSEQQEAFMGALLQDDSRIPPIYVNQRDDEKKTCDVVDGKQRITAILAWLNDEILAFCPSGHTVRYSDFLKTTTDKRILGIRVTLHWRFLQLSEVDAMRFYVALNSGGTIHTENEIARVKRLIVKAERQG